MRRLLTFGLALALALLPMAASAQTAQVGQVRGQVTDATGGALPGVTITLTSEERGFARTTVTDGEGKYLFPVVPLGTYSITAALQSFETKRLTGNLVEAEKTTTVDTSLQLAALEETTTVYGEVPIVDPGNQTQQTRLRAEEFQKMPYGRSYLTLIKQAPGVVGTGNVNTHGALSSNNLFLFDGVDTTDPTTGTFATNSNFEAIQEVLVRTSSVGAEFGRGTGAIVEVISKSGTNDLQGSFKYLITNDNWNAQNTTQSEVAGPDGTFADLGRTKFDQVNPVYAATLGGPIMRNRAWFFGTFEHSKITSPLLQTNAKAGFENEEYQQETTAPVWDLRLDTQLAQGHNLWFKYATDPTDGFVNDYWGTSAERAALTAQDQSGNRTAVQYSGLVGNNLTASATVAHSVSSIDVTTFELGSLFDGAPIIDNRDGRAYNGATFDGRVNRPRTQATFAAEYFANMMSGTHAIKTGIDVQTLESENHFRFPTNRLYLGEDFNPVTRDFQPILFQEFDDAPSISKGTQVAFYVRDKFQRGRLSLEPGLRFEKQTGESDIGATTVDTFTVAPRISGSLTLTPDDETLLVGSYGRFYDGILQGFSDQFASVPQQGNFDLWLWIPDDPETPRIGHYEFFDRFEVGGNTFRPNTDISPRKLDEITVGVERQLSNTLGVTVRYINRVWGDFVDDLVAFTPDGDLDRTVGNIDIAERSYRGFEVTLEKRFANQWSASGSYAFGHSEGNHFADDLTTLADFEGELCSSSDPGLALIACDDRLENLDGKPTFDRPHQFKFNGAYTRPIGMVDLTAGVVGAIASKATYSKTRTLEVLQDGISSGQTQTYFYEPRGSDRIDGMDFDLDLSVEAAVRTFERAQVGLKFDVFNLFNVQEKTAVSNTAWCNSTEGACGLERATYGTATSRGAFDAPTTIRFTFLVRY